MRCKPSLTLSHNCDAEFLATWATPALLMPSQLMESKTSRHAKFALLFVVLSLFNGMRHSHPRYERNLHG